jgi:hypothetical protein
MEGLTMSKLFAYRRSATVVAGGLLALVSIGGTAQAITDTIFKYSAPKTGYFTIDAMAMAPNGGSSAAEFGIAWDAGLTTGNNHCFNAGVNLPNGAHITGVAIFYKSGATSDVSVEFLRKNLANGTFVDVAIDDIADDTNTRQAAAIPLSSTLSHLVVDNAHYSYGFGICMGNSDTFYAARIGYTYTNAGD